MSEVTANPVSGACHENGWIDPEARRRWRRDDQESSWATARAADVINVAGFLPDTAAESALASYPHPGSSAAPADRWRRHRVVGASARRQVI